MKHRIILSLGMAAAIVTGASAQLSYTFDADAQGFQNFAWSASGPVGWSGGAALQAPSAVGGWTLGGSFNYFKEFSWPDQLTLQGISGGGNGYLTFDLIVDGSSFNPGVANWFQINVAGNSAGANGWTQVQVLDSWHNADDNALYSHHVSLTFTQLGWSNPEDATGWFQLYFGANSAGDFPVKFYIDNLNVVPEPSSLALIGLGAAALLGFRRRKA